jgi:ATP-binding cassette subfamily F protein uup
LEHVQQIAEQVEISPGVSISAARFLELFGFPVSFHRIPVGILSGGERRRLHLVSLLMGRPNFLLLDEPTNDLDIDTIRRLEQYILDFTGCVLIVSHDRAFLDRTTETLFVFDDVGGIQEFPGTFSNYHDYLEEQEEMAQEESLKRQTQAIRSNPVRERASKGLSFNEKREYASILDEIEVLEQELLSLEKGFSTVDADPLTLGDRTRRYERVQLLIEQKMERWEELASRADG